MMIPNSESRIIANPEKIGWVLGRRQTQASRHNTSCGE